MYKKFLLIIPIAFIFILIINAILNNLSFHVTKVDPVNGNMSITQDYIEFTTNYQIKNLKKSDIVTNIPIIKSVNYSKNKISINLSRTLITDELFTIKIPNIESVNNKSLTINRTFTGKYISFSDLSEAERARELSKQDTTSKTYPLTNLLPYISKDFQITYKMPNPLLGQTKPIVIITSLKISPNNPTAAIGSTDWLNALTDSRTQAISWLNSKGFNTSTYQLGLSENYLLSQFNGVYIAD